MRNMFKKLVAYVCAFAMVMTGFSGISMVANAEEAPKKYVELSFADIGLDGTYTDDAMCSVSNPTTGRAASMDGVALNGYLTFGNGEAASAIKFAAGSDASIELTPIKLFVANGGFYTWSDLGGSYNMELAKGEPGQKFKVRMAFDYIRDDVQVTFTVDDGEPTVILYKNFVVNFENSFGTAFCGMSARLTTNETSPIKVESDTIPTTKATFHDFGIKDGKHTEACVGSALNEKESLDNVTIQGIVNFPQNQGSAHYLRFGGKTENPWYAISVFHQDNGIWIWDNTPVDNGNHVHLPEGDNTYYGRDLKLAFTFKYLGEDLFVRVDVDDQYVVSFYFQKIIPNLGSHVLVQSTGEPGIIVKSVGDYQHTGTKTDAVPGTCQADGYDAYWTCNVCGKLFSDEACRNEIEAPVNTGKGSHKLTPVAQEDATCTSEGTKAYWECDDCGAKFSDAEGTTAIEKPETIDKLAHKLTYVAKVAATCTKAGSEAYYTCDDCKKMFSDKEGKVEIEKPIVIAKHKPTYVKAVASTYTKTGMKGYYRCSCGKLYTDSACTKATTKAKLTVPVKKLTVAKTSVKSVTAKSKALAVKWTKKSGVTGYEVQVALKKNFKSGLKKATVKGASKTTVTVKKLKAKKTYYVRVRAYKKVEGKTFYSSWSSVKSKKTK